MSDNDGVNCRESGQLDFNDRDLKIVLEAWLVLEGEVMERSPRRRRYTTNPVTEIAPYIPVSSSV